MRRPGRPRPAGPRAARARRRCGRGPRAAPPRPTGRASGVWLSWALHARTLASKTSVTSTAVSSAGPPNCQHLRHLPRRQAELGEGELVARVGVDGRQHRGAGREVVRVVEVDEAVVALGRVGDHGLRPPLADDPGEVAPQRLVDLHRTVGPAEEHALLRAERVGGGLLLGAADAGHVLARHGGVEAAAVAVGDAHDGDLAARAAAHAATRPPAPKSASSGWAPTTSARAGTGWPPTRSAGDTGQGGHAPATTPARAGPARARSR